MSQRKGRRLGRAFFRGDTVELAQRLLGTYLVHDAPEGRAVGRIVETEAYLARGDGASHSAQGRTARNGSMFLGPGHAYVYRIYGVHLCFNVVSGPRGVGEAVLIRALEPVAGQEQMVLRRNRERPLELCRGPGRLTQAMGLAARHDGCDLVEGPLGLHSGDSPAGKVVVGRRVGITRSPNRLLRFAMAETSWVSLPLVRPGHKA